MKVECNKCGKSLNIPDEKIPSNKKVSVSCPACKNKIIVEKPSAEDKSEKPLIEATKTEEKEIAPEKKEEPVEDKPEKPISEVAKTEKKEIAPEKKEEPVKAMDPSEFADEELEVLEEGTKRALICDTVHQDKIAPVLKEMVYQPKAVGSDSEAIGRMKFTQYDLVVLAEDFAGSSLTKNNILKYIRPMPMTTRRKMFVALLGKDFNTMDNMQAFALSVNVVMNYKDVDNIAAILKKSISDNDAFYKVFKETLVALGKT